jgi:hypothetical protein
MRITGAGAGAGAGEAQGAALRRSLAVMRGLKADG